RRSRAGGGARGALGVPPLPLPARTAAAPQERCLGARQDAALHLQALARRALAAAPGRGPGLMPTIEEIVEGRGICVCAGSGRVGTTTASAALAAGLAARGQRVCVLTIDPAKRLADSLGLKELENTPSMGDPKLFEPYGVETNAEIW